MATTLNFVLINYKDNNNYIMLKESEFSISSFLDENLRYCHSQHVWNEF